MTEEYIVRIVRNLENDDYDCITMGELIRCEDCKHRPYRDDDGMIDGDYVCPYLCDDPYYTAMPEDDWFCHRAERIQHD